MSDGEALLRAILEHPADDDRRLVYADWLDDDGQPERAEFIRLQLRLDRPTEIVVASGAVVTFRQLAASETDRRREHQLLASWPAHPRWLGKPDPLLRHPERHALAAGATIECLGAGRVECTFRRGFLAEVTCRIGDWPEYVSALAVAHPIEFVGVTDRKPRLVEVGVLPFWRWYDEENYPLDATPEQTIPRAVYRRVYPDGAPYGPYFETEDAAVRKLSAALLPVLARGATPGVVCD